MATLKIPVSITWDIETILTDPFNDHAQKLKELLEKKSTLRKIADENNLLITHGWYSVEEKLPHYGVEVDVYGKMKVISPKMDGNPFKVLVTKRENLTGTVLEKDRDKYTDKNDFRFMEIVTHWRDRPTPPPVVIYNSND